MFLLIIPNKIVGGKFFCYNKNYCELCTVKRWWRPVAIIVFALSKQALLWMYQLSQ